MSSNFYGVLTPATPRYTIGAGFNTTLYDAGGKQSIRLDAGGSLKLLGAAGNNSISLHGSASEWSVSRDGSTAIFIHEDGGRAEIPAILDYQRVHFSDKSTTLQIDTTGEVAVVKLGLQTLGLESVAVSAWEDEATGPGPGEEPEVGSTEKAPWTLAMVGENDRLYFSDGTASGTVFRDLGGWGYTLTANPAQSEIFIHGFAGLYASDGTAAGTTKLLDTVIDKYSGEPYILGNTFAWLTTGASVVSDGTEAGTHFLPSIGSNRIIDYANGNIWFARHYQPYGTELGYIAVTSGPDGNSFVKDINPGTASGISSLHQGSAATLPDGRLVFSGDDGTGREPWVSDGTQSGTFQLIDAFADGFSWESSNPQNFTSFGDSVGLVASFRSPDNAALNIGRELVITDGTTEGTSWLDIYEGVSSSNPEILGVKGDKLYFAATDSSGRGVFSTDGKTFEHLSAIEVGATLLGFTEETAFFRFTDGLHGDELWAADLLTGEFSLTRDILAGTGSALPYSNEAEIIGNKLAFSAYVSATQQRYFVSDGTEAGTVHLGDKPTDTATVGNNHYFVDVHGIHVVDINASAPEAVKLASVPPSTGLIDVLQQDSDHAFYLDASGQLLSHSEGVSERLADNVVKFKIVAENALYIIAQENNTATLWYSDGTAAGTRLVETLAQAADFHNLEGAVAVRTAGVAQAPDTASPVLISSMLTGDQITLVYSGASSLDGAAIPDIAQFSTSGTDASITSVAVDSEAKKVFLTLDQSVLSTDRVRLSYSDPTPGDDALAIQDVAGNDAVSFDRLLSNRTADNIAPKFVSATVEGDELVLVYSDSSALDAIELPSTSAFELSGTSAVVSSVSILASQRHVVLRLSEKVGADEELTINYVGADGTADLFAIQDIEGNLAGPLFNQSVQNITLEQALWSLVSVGNHGILVSDGTASGTSSVAGYYGVTNLIVNESQTIALATGRWSNPVYVTDGTIAGTKKLYDNFSVSQLYEFGDKFVLWNSSSSLLTDGSDSGTAEISEFPSLYEAVRLEDGSILHAQHYAPYGNELTRTIIEADGVSSSLVKDISPGSSSGISTLSGAQLPDGRLIFSAEDESHGNEPWITDGSSTGTKLLSDIREGAYSSNPRQYTVFGDKVAFVAHTPVYPTEKLFITDGSSPDVGTSNIFASSRYISIIGVTGENLYFTAPDAGSIAIFSTDGESVFRLADVSQNAKLLGFSEEKAFFSLSDGVHGTELWAADFSNGAFNLVKDILPGSGASLINTSATMAGNKLAFTAYTSATERAYFVSDGTESGTVQIGNVPSATVSIGGHLYFADEAGVHSLDLTAEVPSSVTISPSVAPTSYSLQSDSDQLFFTDIDGDLFVVDEIDKLQLASGVAQFAVLEENAVYMIVQNDNAASLWFSDGTVSGTRFVDNLSGAPDSYDLQNSVAIRTVGVSDAPVEL